MCDKKMFRISILMIILLCAASSASAQGNSDFVQRALEDTTFTWFSSESKGVRIYYQQDSFAEKHRMMILRSISTAVDEVLEFLGESKYDRLLHVFYLDSRGEMERIVGRPYSGSSNWTASGIFVVLNPEWRSFEKHEFTHVVTMGKWGSPHATSRWMIEGIAISCDGWCREYTVDEIAYYFLTHDQFPPLQELFNDFSALGEIRGGFYAASIIGFIRHKYGVEALRNLWFDGIGNVTELLGTNVNQLEAAWKNYLRLKVRNKIYIDLETIEKLGCG